MSTAILAEGLVKRFGELVALDGVDFEAPAGSVLGLLGPNGAGKTTAVRILSTILAPDGGRAEVLGRDVVRDPDGVRRRIGLAGQYAAVDPNLTGRENLRMTGRLAQLDNRLANARADELLERFDLAGAADRPVRTYSGGMRRRLDVAAALVARPPVVFLDEPTTGLDLFSRNELWEMIRELVADGTTVLLTTQYLEEADRLAERVVVIDGGRVIADDTPAALKSQLGSTVIEMGLGDDGRAARAGELLEQRLGLRPEREEAAIRLTTADGSRVLIDALRTLDDEGLTPATLAVREPSLDDVFLAITGRRAKDAAAAANGAAASRGRSARKRESPASEASRSRGIGGSADRGTRGPDLLDASPRPFPGGPGEPDLAADLTAQGADRGGADAGNAMPVGQQSSGFEGPEVPGDLRGKLGAALLAFSAAQSALAGVQAALAAGRAPTREDFAALANVGSALTDIARPLGADPATATLAELKARLAARERSSRARHALGRLAEATGPQVAAASLAGLSSEAARLAAAPSWSQEDEARASVLAALVELADVATDNDDGERIVALDAELRNALGPGAVAVVLAAARGRLVVPADSAVTSETSGR